MPDVTLWGRELAGGALPGVCVQTGVPTDSTARVRFRTVPGWTWIFLLLGLLPVVIVQAITQVTADGRVPLVPERRRRITLVRTITAGLVVGGVVTLVAALILGTNETTGAVSALLFGLTPLLLLGGILAGVIGNAFVRVRGSVHRHPSVPDRWIVLDAHPAFGAAVESWRAAGSAQPVPPAPGA